MNFLDKWLRRYKWWRQFRGLPEPMPIRMTELTRQALSILHDKVNFVSHVNREYSPVEGATLRIRTPAQYGKKASNGSPK